MTSLRDDGLVGLDGYCGSAELQIKDDSIGNGCGFLGVIDGLAHACDEALRR